MAEMVRLDRLLFPEPVSAGMNVLVVASFTLRYRGTNEHLDPIRLDREGDNFRIADGRHRVVASIMAGRKEILADTGEDSPLPREFVGNEGLTL